MENTIFTQAAKFLRRRRDDRRWKAVVFCLAIMVIGATAWLLTRKSQALTHAGDILACPVAVHVHTADCMDENGIPVCGKADYVFHMHNADCYDADGRLVCQLPETEPHEHDKDCFIIEKTLICGYEEKGTEPASGEESPEGDESVASTEGETQEQKQTAPGDGGKELICSREEHTHGADCYEGAERQLVCDLQEAEKHEHDDSCYTIETQRILTCGMEKTAHTHTDSCYTENETRGELTCTDEDETHTHDDSCYEKVVDKELTCSQEEGGHTHTDSCYQEQTEKKLTCTKDTEGHTHTDDCYAPGDGTVLVCEKEEHTHGEACYQETDTDSSQDETQTAAPGGDDNPVDSEPPENPGHIHTDDCYQAVRKLACGQKGAHIHDDDCYQDGVLICEVPYVESVEEHVHDEKCFEPDEEEEYTKSFSNDRIVVTVFYRKSAQIPEDAVLDVEEVTAESDAQLYEKRLNELMDAQGAMAESDSLAMLLKIGFRTDDERFMPEDTVRFTVRFLDDSVYAAGDTAKAACFDSDGVRRIITDMEVDSEGTVAFELNAFEDLAFIASEEKDSAHTLTYECEDFVMTVIPAAGTQFPEDAKLTVDRITEQNNPVHYEERLAQLDGQLMAMLLRVWISADGIDTGLKEKASVKIQFRNDAVYSEGDAVTAACFDGEDVGIISGTDIDDERSTTFEVESLSELALLFPEEADGRVLTYEDEDYIITVSLGEGTQIPEDAELMAEQITLESDEERYKARLAQLEETEGMLEEDEGIAVLLRVWLSADGEEIALDGTADVKVQFLDNELYFEGDAVKAAHFAEESAELLDTAAIDSEGATSFEVGALGEFAFITENARTMTYEGEDFIVTVRFHETAQIPENAELIAERITEESDPEHFSERADVLQEQAEDGKYVTMNLLMKIGFYVKGEEIEPQDTVDVKIQMLDRERLDLELEEDNPPKIVHFAGDGMEILEDADVVEDEENSLTTTFLIDSFSEIAMVSESDGITTPEQFHTVMEKAVDGQTVVIGANIEFPQPQVSYTRDTRPGDGRVPESDDLVYKGYHVGDTGEVIIAKLQTPGASYETEHKHITLDLNGYTLRLLGDNMTLVDICWGAELTVKDSWAEKTDEEKAADPRPDVYSISYDITTSAPVDSFSGKTAESTETRTASGGAMVGNGFRGDFWQDDGAHANGQGSGGNRAAVITMWFGKLHFDGGIIAENANRAIRCRAGEINLNGGYLLNNAAKEHYPREGENKYTYGTSDPRWYGYYGGALGGAVACEEVPGWYFDWRNVTIDETTGVAPRAPGTIHLRGTILSGNRALQGGAIHATGCHIDISGGYVTHNRAFFRYWGGGGGGIKVDGPIATQSGLTVGAGDFTMTGGQITANEVAGGGGGICITRRAEVDLKGGFIAGNTTMSGANGEGGGVALYEEWTKIFIDTKYEEITNPDELPKDEEGNPIYPVKPEVPPEGFYVSTPFAPTARIGDPAGTNSLYITNNHSRSETDWGGGGLFVSEGATAYLYNILITENSAKGFGGGLAGCATGRILDFTDLQHGAAIFGNSASGDAYAGDESAKHEDRDYTRKDVNPVFWERDAAGRYLFQDYFSALYSRLGNGMIGGGSENWDGSMDGERLGDIKKDDGGKWMASYVAGLTAHPSEADKAAAKSFTHTYITGNTSVTHGGGVMCNGIISIGEGQMEITCAMQLKATKAIKDGETITGEMQPGQFTFTVYEETAKTAANWQEQELEAKLGAIVSTGTNDAHGNIEFNKLLTIQKTGWVRFFMVEDKVSDQDASMGIETDPTAYIISLWVEKVKKTDPERLFYDIKKINLERGWIVSLDDGLYFKFATAEEGRWIYWDQWDHGYTNDQLYHSEDHPLIMDLTKGVMKYDYPEYHIVVPYEHASQYTFTNTKKQVTKVQVTKKWEGWADSERSEILSVLVKLYKDGQLYNGDGDPKQLADYNDWTVSWENLPADGKYSVVEDLVIYKDNSNDPAENKCEVKYEYTMSGTQADVTITNAPKAYSLELTKKGKNGEGDALLPGAKFQILNGPQPLFFKQVLDGYIYVPESAVEAERQKGVRVSNELFTDDKPDADSGKGKLIVSGLPAGTYTLREIEAPHGYKEAVDHTIIFNGTETRVECGKAGDHEITASDSDNFTLRFILTDEERKYVLPKTGGFGKDCIFIPGIVILAGMGTLIFMTCRRRKETGGEA